MSDDAIKIARLEVQTGNIEGKVDAGFTEIKMTLKDLGYKVDVMSNFQIKIQEQDVRLAALEKRAFRNAVVYPVASAVLSSVLTLLIVYYLSNVGKGL